MTETEQQYPLRSKRRNRTRERIVLAASERFSKYGFKDTTMNAIADDAGVHVTTVFNHFPTKRDLVAEVNDGAVSLLADAMDLHRGRTPFFSFIRGVIISASSIQASRPAGIHESVLIGDDPEVLSVWVTSEAKKAQLMAEYIAEENGLDLKKDLRPALIANMIVTGTVQAFIAWQEASDKIDLVAENLKVIDAVEQLLKSGLDKKTKRKSK